MESPHEAADRADVRRVLEGDSSAFEGIVDRWQRPLVNLAYRFCRDRGRAEEMAQEAFLRVFRSLSRWRAEAAFSTWLFAVALNVYRSHLRRVRPREVPLEPSRHAAAAAGPANGIEREDTAEAVRRGVSTLPAKYRDALVLFYFHEQDVQATARALGVAQGTVKARLHRGRAMLRDRLSAVLHPALPDEAEAR